jgi:conjugative transfer region protein TrbK
VETRTFATISAIALAAIALVATALSFTRKPEPPAIFAAPPLAQAANADPLAPELVRCSTLGEAAEKDPACLSVWAQSRRRFLGEGH